VVNIILQQQFLFQLNVLRKGTIWEG